MNKIIGSRQAIKNRAYALRKLGKSYNEISKILCIPKSTLSGWLKNLPFSVIIKNRLIDKNKKIWAENIVRFNKLRPLKTRIRHEGLRKVAVEEYKKLKLNPLFIAGVMIYWGEGDKGNNGRVMLINSDYKVIKIFNVFLQKICGVPTNRLRMGLYIYDDLDKKLCISRWPEMINIPRTQFIQTQILPSRSKLTHNRLKNGVACLYTCNTELKIKILAWIEEFYKEYAGIV